MKHNMVGKLLRTLVIPDGLLRCFTFTLLPGGILKHIIIRDLGFVIYGGLSRRASSQLITYRMTPPLGWTGVQNQGSTPSPAWETRLAHGEGLGDQP